MLLRPWLHIDPTVRPVVLIQHWDISRRKEGSLYDATAADICLKLFTEKGFQFGGSFIAFKVSL
jgi:hypothetical protein